MHLLTTIGLGGLLDGRRQNKTVPGQHVAQLFPIVVEHGNGFLLANCLVSETSLLLLGVSWRAGRVDFGLFPRCAGRETTGGQHRPWSQKVIHRMLLGWSNKLVRVCRDGLGRVDEGRKLCWLELWNIGSRVFNDRREHYRVGYIGWLCDGAGGHACTLLVVCSTFFHVQSLIVL